MKLTVKSDKSEGTIMYVKKATLQKIKAQAPQLGFPSMASYLEALSNLPVRKIKELF